jgi:hypothetical protein
MQDCFKTLLELDDGKCTFWCSTCKRDGSEQKGVTHYDLLSFQKCNSRRDLSALLKSVDKCGADLLVHIKAKEDKKDFETSLTVLTTKLRERFRHPLSHGMHIASRMLRSEVATRRNFIRVCLSSIRYVELSCLCSGSLLADSSEQSGSVL